MLKGAVVARSGACRTWQMKEEEESGGINVAFIHLFTVRFEYIWINTKKILYRNVEQYIFSIYSNIQTII